MNSIVPLRDRCRGKWRSLLPIFGVEARYLTSAQGPCPVCEEGKDRFRFDDKDGAGTWYCNRCGAGDGVSLVMAVNCWEFKEAAKWLEEMVGGVATEPVQAAPDHSKARMLMNRLWRESRPLSDGCPVSLWFQNRVQFVPTCADLRYHPKLCYQDGKDGERSFHPAMLAMVRDVNGKPVSLHRTYLTMDGKKANVPKPRKMPYGAEMPAGAAVRLMPFTEVAGIAEGIETAFAAWQLFGVPTWSALNAGALEKWVAPSGVAVTIYADHDEAGRKAARELGGRLLDRGENVHIYTPEKSGDDWNDVLLRRRRQAA